MAEDRNDITIRIRVVDEDGTEKLLEFSGSAEEAKRKIDELGRAGADAGAKLEGLDVQLDRTGRKLDETAVKAAVAGEALKRLDPNRMIMPTANEGALADQYAGLDPWQAWSAKADKSFAQVEAGYFAASAAADELMRSNQDLIDGFDKLGSEGEKAADKTLHAFTDLGKGLDDLIGKGIGGRGIWGNYRGWMGTGVLASALMAPVNAMLVGVGKLGTFSGIGGALDTMFQPIINGAAQLGQALAGVFPILGSLAGGFSALLGPVGAVAIAFLAYPALMGTVAAASTGLELAVQQLFAVFAIIAGATGPIALLVGLLGSLGFAFYKAFTTAKDASAKTHPEFAAFHDLLNEMSQSWHILGGTLANDFLPYLETGASVVLRWVEYFNQLARMGNIAEVFRSIGTRGVAMMNRDFERFGHFIGPVIADAIKTAFGRGGSNVQRDLSLWANQISSWSNTAFKPIKEWFAKQHFEATGKKWMTELWNGLKSTGIWSQIEHGFESLGSQMGAAFGHAFIGAAHSEINSLLNWLGNPFGWGGWYTKGIFSHTGGGSSGSHSRGAPQPNPVQTGPGGSGTPGPGRRAVVVHHVVHHLATPSPQDQYRAGAEALRRAGIQLGIGER